MAGCLQGNVADFLRGSVADFSREKPAAVLFLIHRSVAVPVHVNYTLLCRCTKISCDTVSNWMFYASQLV